MHCGLSCACVVNGSCSSKMAAYKDDFYYGSDFSDFSENEADLGDISDGNFGSDDEGIPLYCICNLPGTTEMIACDGEGCKIEWFHYECVGFASDTIPTETSPWFCEFCRPNGMVVFSFFFTRDIQT